MFGQIVQPHTHTHTEMDQHYHSQRASDSQQGVGLPARLIFTCLQRCADAPLFDPWRHNIWTPAAVSSRALPEPTICPGIAFTGIQTGPRYRCLHHHFISNTASQLVVLLVSAELEPTSVCDGAKYFPRNLKAHSWMTPNWIAY